MSKKKHLITVTKETLGPIVTAYAADRAVVEEARAACHARRAELQAQIDLIEAEFAITHAEEMARLDGVLESVARFVTRHESSLFADGDRHVDFGGVRVGVRLTPWSVAKTGKETWEQIAIGMRDSMPEYVRVKYSVDKESLLRDRTTVDDLDMTAVGLVFTQDDVVFIESVA